MWTAVAELAIPLVCFPRYGLRAGVTVDLLSEEGSRYPRARTIHQWKPTLKSELGAVPKASPREKRANTPPL